MVRLATRQKENIMMKTFVTQGFVTTFVIGALAACSSSATDGSTGETTGATGEAIVDGAHVQWGGQAHALPFKDHSAPQAAAPVAAAPAGAHLTYWGGPVISNVNVVKVEYGAGTYQSFVTGTGAGTVASFYTGVTNSPYFDWLSEYNTPTQTIGRGSYQGDHPITPASSRNKATISDANIQAELNAQITAGHLPAPTANTLYSVHFPKGKRISLGTSRSCVAGGFCAYHGTFVRNGVNVYYAVLPDMSAGSGCDVGCGTGTPFGNQTSVASHEMIEAVTDAAVGLATVVGPPLAWYDATNGEIGDICNGVQGTVVGGDGATYTIQKEWSNSRNACVSQ
jgi:hypothetical protein